MSSFSRQMGRAPGVQVAPTVQMVDSPLTVSSDKTFAAVARTARGRFDRPFMVNLDNLVQRTGRPESMRRNRLAEGLRQVKDGLQAGAAGAVVQRLVGAGAAKKFGFIKFDGGAAFAVNLASGQVSGVTVTAGGAGYATGQRIEFEGNGHGAAGTIVADGSGAITSVTVTDGGDGYTSATARMAEGGLFGVSDAAPTDFDLYFDHEECFNDGLIFSVHAAATPLVGAKVANRVINLRVIDPFSHETLFDITGSLDPDARDDYGNSAFISDVAETLTGGNLRIVANATASVLPDSAMYGRTVQGRDRWVTTPALVMFSEGATEYLPSDIGTAVSRLRGSQIPFGYLISGGTENVVLISELVKLADAKNLTLVVDIRGTLSASAAASYAASLAITTHLVELMWRPVECFDDRGGQRETWGAGGAAIGMRCARNANVNADGLARKNYPVAGFFNPMDMVAPRQITPLTDTDFEDLNGARINPVCFEVFSDGGRYVVRDSITCYPSTEFLGLSAVVDMATSLERQVAGYAGELKQLPMQEAISRMNRYLLKLLKAAQSAEWLVPSTKLGGAAFSIKVGPSAESPRDRVRIEFFASYDGTARQFVIQQRIAG
jgi:hypothetical protein